MYIVEWADNSKHTFTHVHLRLEIDIAIQNNLSLHSEAIGLHGILTLYITSKFHIHTRTHMYVCLGVQFEIKRQRLRIRIK